MMKDKDTENLIKELKKKVNDTLTQIPKYIIEIGVFENLEGNLNTDVTKTKNKREDEGNQKNGQLVINNNDITNAKIMFWMEYGSPVNDYPARPILHQTVEWAQQNLLEPTVIKGVKAFLKSGDIKDFELELKKMCMRMKNHVKTGVRHREFDIAPNAFSTIERKGSDLPLLDTGQLVNSIQCIYKKL